MKRLTPEATIPSFPALVGPMWRIHPFQASGILVGQVGRLEWELCLPTGAAVAVVALGIWVIIRVKRWRQELMDGSSPSPQDLLNEYEALTEEGLLSPDELARIRARLEQSPPEEVSTPEPPHPPTDSPPLQD